MAAQSFITITVVKILQRDIHIALDCGMNSALRFNSQKSSDLYRASSPPIPPT